MFSSAINAIRELGHSIGTSKRFIDNEFCIQELVEDLKSSSTTKKREGLKKITCMLQRGIALTECHVYILKMSETRDPLLKRMISYYLQYCSKNSTDTSRIEAADGDSENLPSASEKAQEEIVVGGAQKQIYNPEVAFEDQANSEKQTSESIFEQYTNTLLKDLGDKSGDIRNSALEFLAEMGEPELFPSFSRRIRKILQEGSAENKARSLLLLERLLAKDNGFLGRNNFVDEVMNIIKLGSFQLQICALKCINPATVSFIKKEKLIGL